MAQTQRSSTELYALHADNTSGNASNEDIRDIIESMMPGYALMDVNRADGGWPALTTITDNNATAIAGVTKQDGPTPRWFTVGTDGTITYTGAKDVLVTINSHVSFKVIGSVNLVIGYGFMLNGVSASSDIGRYIATGANEQGAAGNTWQIEMSNGDYINAYVKNDDSTDDITVVDYHVNVIAFIK